MIAPSYFPTLEAKDDSAETYCRVIDRLRFEQRRGDDRAGFVLMVLSRMPRYMAVSFGAHLLKPGDGGSSQFRFQRGQFVLTAGGLS